MITKEDVTNIISQSYAKASSAETRDMHLASDLFESVRDQLEISNPYTPWEFLILDNVKFDNDYTLELLIDLRESYFNLLYEKLLNYLDELFKADKKEALTQWIKIYSEAAVNFRDDLVCMLCYKKHKWKIKNALTDKYSRLPKYMRESRWPDAFPLYKEIADNTELSAEVRTYAEIILMEIILYYYPETSSAMKHLENARTLLPGDPIIERGQAEYYFKTGEIQKARNGFLQAISMRSGDYVSFNLIGDCFSSESNLESAESWYKDGIKNNLLQSESYKRLLTLYGNKSWFSEKQPEIESLLDQIGKRVKFREHSPLIEKNSLTKDCFINFMMYDSYRDVAASWFAIEDFKKAEEWYNKAKQLMPEAVNAGLDLGYVKLKQQEPAKALEYFLEALKNDSENYDVHWGLAYYYEGQGQTDEALKNYKECIRLRPEWSDWVNNFIGNMYFSKQNYKESEIYYRKAVELNDKYPVYRQNLAGAVIAQANLLADASKNDEAEKLYLSAAAIDNDPGRWNSVGNFYYKLTKWKKAADSYDKAIAINDADPVIHENRGLVHEQMKEYDLAESSYKRANELDKVSGRYYNRLGVFYYNLKKYEQSVENYKSALKREPENAVYLENICLSYEMMDKMDQAEPYYLRLLKLEPANDNIMNLLGIMYYKRKDYEKAIEYYNKAIGINKKNAIYYENLSSLYRDRGQYQEAIEALQKALELEPGNDISWNNAGVYYYNISDHDNALKCYFKALEIKPNVSLYNENIALAYDMKKQYKDAIPYYEKALEIYPENAEAHNSMGVNYLNQKNYELAAKSFRSAVAIDGSNVIFQRNLGHALASSGKKVEAKTVLEKAIKIKEDYYLSWNDLGVLYYEEGNLTEALNCYNKAISLNPDDPVLYTNLALALNEQGKTIEAINVSSHPLLKNNEVKKEVTSMLQKSLPSLFNSKN